MPLKGALPLKQLLMYRVLDLKCSIRCTIVHQRFDTNTDANCVQRSVEEETMAAALMS